MNRAAGSSVEKALIGRLGLGLLSFGLVPSERQGLMACKRGMRKVCVRSSCGALSPTSRFVSLCFCHRRPREFRDFLLRYSHLSHYLRSTTTASDIATSIDCRDRTRLYGAYTVEQGILKEDGQDAYYAHMAARCYCCYSCDTGCGPDLLYVGSCYIF
jgi:hypothetical protein